MKTMKQLFALILALTMVFAMASVVSAAAMTDTGTLTIENATAGTTYTLYRILDIEKDPDGKTNVYILNDKWRDFINDNSEWFTLSNNYVKKVKLSSEADAQTLAVAVVNYAKDHSIDHDGQSKMTISGDYTSSTPRQYGYYILASDHEGAGVQYTVFCLDNATITIKEKNSTTAAIHKYVQEDSKIDEADGGWGSSNAAEIEQPVSFKIVVDLAPGTDTYIIEDEMPNFDNISEPVLEYSGGGITKDNYTYETTANGFKITLKDTFRKQIEKGQTLTLTYTAKLKPSAIIAGDGNKNTVYLDNDADHTTNLGSATTTTYTYKVDISKVNETSSAMQGATFTLSHKGANLKFHANGTNNYIVDPEGTVESFTTDETGKFSISGLDTEDEYVLTETVAPSGYVLMEPVTIKIDATNIDSTCTVTVVNLPGVTMPETGGMGTTLFYVLGGVLVCAAAVLLVTKKRMGTAK